MTRAVFFDVDGVLVHGYHVREEKRRRWDAHMLEDLGIEQSAFYDLMVRDVLPNQVLPGKRSLVSALEEVLPKVGYNGSPMTVISYWLRRDTQLNLPLLELIKRLRQSGTAKLYIATNQEDTRAFYLWDNLGLQHLFDDIFHAARLGATKPHRAFFQAIEKRLGRQSEPPLMFDDMPEVAKAANEFGWEGVHADEFDDIASHPWIVGRLGRRTSKFAPFAPRMARRWPICTAEPSWRRRTMTTHPSRSRVGYTEFARNSMRPKAAA